jgi:dipeptidyl aminopeptidase/acylaminoacyl peptidase
MPYVHRKSILAPCPWAAVLLLVFLVTPVVAERFGPKHVAKLKRVTSAAISPDGKQIAYGLAVQRNPLDGKDGSAWVELHVTDLEGNSRPFVTGEVNVGSIQWMHDGRRIAYTAKRHGDQSTTLYAIPFDGGESQRLLEHDSSVRGVAFCPSDQRVAFIATQPRTEQQNDMREKGFNQQIYEEDWRPGQIWVADLSGDATPKVLELEGSASSVSWSADGRKLAVVLAPTSLVDDSYMFKRVRIVDAETGRILQEINNLGKLGQVKFGPDGKHVAMISGVDIHDPKDGHLMIAQVPGDGAITDLTPELEGHVTSFAWKDESTLLCVVDERQQTSVRSITLEGNQELLVEPQGPVLARLALSLDGQAISLLGHSPRFPHEVFVMKTGSQPKRLTESNPWLDEMEFAEQEVVTWQARDGLQIEGVLVKPLNYEEGQRYPLIMSVHGGPEAHVANGWVTSYSYAGQVGAARGFAVLYPNYRGSTGRGVEFSKLGQADAAGKEFDDLIDAIDHLAAQGMIDKDKVGITGGSYGGYASAWGATFYSDRYAASVMFVGISDNVSKVGTTDIPEEMYLVHHLKRLWDDWDYFIERSPIRHVQKNKTPTLIMHGKEDPRVHPSQSLELFRHLKTLDQAPVRLVLFEGEGHGNRKAAARLDYHLRMLRWMEHYLQGPGGPAPDYELDYEKALQ